MTDFRALSIELLDCLEKADWPPRYRVVFQQWVDIASAALAEPSPASKAILEAFHEQHFNEDYKKMVKEQSKKCAEYMEANNVQNPWA